MLGAHHRSRSGFLASALSLPGERREEREVREQADEALERLGLADVADRPAGGLPYGTLKRVELARALCQRPRLLMLDEPASGLSHERGRRARPTLIAALRDDLDLTVLLVEHHMGMVMRISDHVVVLDFGREIADGTPAEVQRGPERVIEAYLGAPASEPARGRGPRGRLRPGDASLRGISLQRRRGPDRHAARRQRRRQDDHAARDLGHGRAARARSASTARTSSRRSPEQIVRLGDRARARGPRHVRRR